MDNNKQKKQFETEKYKNQANLAYIGTMVISAILSWIFFFLVDSTLIAVLNFGAVIVSGLAIWLNHLRRYGLSSLIYIGYISAVSVVEVLIFSLDAGFQYFFFSLVALITFTNWRPWQKLTGVLLETALFITVFFLDYGKTPPMQLSYELTCFFHTLNVLLNTAGIANSTHYYISIATKAYKQVSNLAMRDYLTGLMNRTSFDDFILHTFKTRKNTSQSLALLILDIDHFKMVNDTCGHLCGDEILRQLASILTKNIRAGDYAARYGGEEFIIIAKLEKPEQLQNFAERLRQEVETTKFQFGDGEKHITVSIGALFISPQAVTDQYQALNQADKLLYRAKAEGRNRVVIEQMGT